MLLATAMALAMAMAMAMVMVMAMALAGVTGKTTDSQIYHNLGGNQICLM